MTHIPTPAERLNLALAIVQHRAWHPDDQASIDELRLALLGATIDEINEMKGAGRVA